jgi:serine/threonine-protein kinase RsbW
VEETALEYANSAGFDADTACNLAMVAREAAANAVIHGNRYNPALQVSATFEISPDALTIRVADSGPGLDPAQIPDPLAPQNLLRSSGRGVFLMRAFMDEVHFRKSQPGAQNPGTEVTLVKRRTRPA